jgi:hypothetical protein
MSAFEDGQIEVTAIYGAATSRGLVQVMISRPTVLLTPAKAREIATFLLEAAGAAEGDEAMMTVLGRMDLDMDQMSQFLVALRTEREKIDQRSQAEARQALAYDRSNPDSPEETPDAQP